MDSPVPQDKPIVGNGVWRGMTTVLAAWAIGLDIAGIAFGGPGLRVLCIAVGGLAGGVAIERMAFDLWRDRGRRP